MQGRMGLHRGQQPHAPTQFHLPCKSSQRHQQPGSSGLCTIYSCTPYTSLLRVAITFRHFLISGIDWSLHKPQLSDHLCYPSTVSISVILSHNKQTKTLVTWAFPSCAKCMKLCLSFYLPFHTFHVLCINSKPSWVQNGSLVGRGFSNRFRKDWDALTQTAHVCSYKEAPCA